jgi:hypothetical protein
MLVTVTMSDCQAGDRIRLSVVASPGVALDLGARKRRGAFHLAVDDG